jgi:3-phosphoshikimate 1-carboxyvinyltransferase
VKLDISNPSHLKGTVRVPGDKSISHRACLLGALSHGRTEIRNFLPATDCLSTVACLRALGVQVDMLSDTQLVVHGQGLNGLSEPDDVLNCGGSGTTIRLLSGILAGQPFCSVLTGNDQLRRRPMARVVAPLRMMGANIWGRDNGRLPPLCIQGGPLEGMDYSMPVASAQVKSAILLAGLRASGPTTIRESGLARDHTERMLKARGADLRSTRKGIVTLVPDRELSAVDSLVPGDMSSAAFLIAAACLVPGSELVIQDVGVNPTRTGLVEALRLMGANVSLQNEREIGGEPLADVVVRASELKAIEVGGAMIPKLIDELPLLALAATQAHGVTIIRDADELRVKETDRIATTSEELRKLGAHIEPQPDGFVIEGPTPLVGTDTDSHGDHRLAMTLAVAGLFARGQTCVHDTECIDDSFPGFEALLAQITGA